MTTPEISFGCIKTGINDGRTNAAGAAEFTHQCLAISPADRALKCGQVFTETSQRFDFGSPRT